MASRPVFLELWIGEAALSGVRELVLERRLGEPPRARVELRLPTPVAPAELVGQPARLLLGRTELEHQLDGVVTEARLSALELEGAYGAVLVIESRLALMRETVETRIFVGESTQQIVSTLLGEHGLGPERQRWSLATPCAPRDVVVQYRESALDFVRRLLEDEGIVLATDCDADGELALFFDTSSSVDTIEGDPELPFDPSGGLDASRDAIVRATEACAMSAGKVTLRDYDFARPSLEVSGVAEDEAHAELERYEAHVGPIDPKALEHWARVRLEAEAGTRHRLELDGVCLRLVPGRLLSLVGAPGELDGEHFIVEVRHHFDDREGQALVQTRAVVQPKGVPYRLERVAPRPSALGHDTAFVAAPKGSEVETIHCDEHARAKLRFRYDRSGRVYDDASAWVRVAQLQTAGSQILPRLDWEVVVEYLEADPDRPVITGRLYNGAIPPPYALPQGKTRTVLQSASTPGGKGRNEIRIEDAAGSEELAIRAQADQLVQVACDSVESIVSHFKHEIGGSLTSVVGGAETVKITSGTKVGSASETLVVAATREVTVDAVMGLSSKGTIETSIGGGLTAMIGSPLKGLIDLGSEVVAEAVHARAEEAVTAIQDKTSGAVDQLLGSVTTLAANAAGVSQAMAEAEGVAGLADALGASESLPRPSELGPWLTKSVGLDDALKNLGDGAMKKLGEALGREGAGGGGSSEANEAGPDGSLPANAAAAGACGPGHAILHALASYDEVVGGAKVIVAAGKVTTVVSGARTASIGAARVELTASDRVETAASKSETSAGRVVLASGAVAEVARGTNESTVGGAILEKVGGNAAVEAGGAVAMAGAFWKVDAKSAIVFECGGSSVTIASAGIEIKTPSLNLAAATIKLSKSGTER